MDEMPQFTCLEWRDIKRVGRYAVVHCDKERPRDDSGLFGRKVLIDGVEYDCLQVSRRPMGLPMQPGEEIALMVEKYPRS